MYKKSFIFVWFLALFAVCFTACNGGGTAKQTADELPEYTIIYYSCGSDVYDNVFAFNLHDFYAAKAESHQKVKVAVQYKFSPEESFRKSEDFVWWVNAMADGYGFSVDQWMQKRDRATMRFVLDPNQPFNKDVKDSEPMDSVFLKDSFLLPGKDIDSGDPQTLTDFISWAVSNVPAKKYVVVIGGIGIGYRPDLDLPQGASNEAAAVIGELPAFLSVSEIASAIKKTGIKPDAIYLENAFSNSIEILYELKDIAPYVVCSTFENAIYPSFGTLLDELAQHDTETALANYCDKITSVFKKEFTSEEGLVDCRDISVIRTAGLDAFGVLFRGFTDRLIDAYQNGGKDAKTKIDGITANFPYMVRGTTPAYTLTDYAGAIMDALPKYFPADFKNRFMDAYKSNVIRSIATESLAKLGSPLSCSILMGCKNYYKTFLWEKGALAMMVERFADGTLKDYSGDGKLLHETKWGSTLDATYKQLQFDKATLWSRWIEVNEQETAKKGPMGF
jgi:hypothetical protein